MHSIATYDYEPSGPFFLVGHGHIGRPAVEAQMMGLENAAAAFVDTVLPAVEGDHGCIVDSEEVLVVLVSWPNAAPFPVWTGCRAALDALRPFVGDDDLVDLWQLEASGALDEVEMP